jgi:hypothetical protein
LQRAAHEFEQEEIRVCPTKLTGICANF